MSAASTFSRRKAAFGRPSWWNVRPVQRAKGGNEPPFAQTALDFGKRLLGVAEVDDLERDEAHRARPCSLLYDAHADRLAGEQLPVGAVADARLRRQHHADHL